MGHVPPVKLNPISFLQMFVTQSFKIAAQMGGAQCANKSSYIEVLGLSASQCLEATSRKHLALEGPINFDEYAELIINIKNRIGGNFSRASAEAGVVRVISTACPFGEAVKEAPELCQMTSSVFGGIAARNFGYAKVELRRRIASNDAQCEVCVYTDPERGRDHAGDEYRSEAGLLVSRSADSEVTVRIQEKLEKTWCMGVSGNAKIRPKLVAESASMRKALEAVEIVAPTLATVMISGETGVGKEVIARAIHGMSNRFHQPFVAVNCGSIPADLVESMVFGHEKGAFTGAYDVHHGFFERAEKGTLFFDEIDSLPLSAQVKLLRVLQEGEYERVGGRQTLRADVRIIAASNRDIQDMMVRGEFRKDLYYRLNVVPIHIPPLRERREDVPALVKQLLWRLAEKYGDKRKMLGPVAWAKVMTYDWPGNVRELENVLERAFLFVAGPVIEDLTVGPEDRGGAPQGVFRKAKRQAAKEIESIVLREAMRHYYGDVCAVAKHMGITSRAVYQKLKVHQLNASAYRQGKEVFEAK